MTDQNPPRRPGTAPPLRVPANVKFGGASDNADAPTTRAPTVPAAARAAQERAAAAIRVGEDRSFMQPETETQRVRQRKLNNFVPVEARSWDELGIDPEMVLGQCLRMLVGQSKVSGKQISEWADLPLPLVGDVLNAMKQRKLIEYLGTNAIGDHLVQLTTAGNEAALESKKVTSYVGSTPVPYKSYLLSIRQQSLTNANPGPEDLQRAFGDIDVSDDMLDRLGPAIASCKSLFLYGPPGNGKTTIAERITRAFGDAIWIPRTLSIGGTLVKLFDPAVHKPIEPSAEIQRQFRIDRRWVLIERPTVITGGELTLDMLELQFDATNNVCEAPLQLKANCGTLVIDDFGRGHTSPQDLLNRWIFPLEKRYDFLKLPDGRKVECPFDCLLVFSTNLEPRDLADEAFMRRIPYKIYANNPDEEEFKALIEKTAAKYGVSLMPHSVKYLIDRHYKMANREFRFCHPRDLLSQVVHYAEYTNTEAKCGPSEWDRVVSNYFGLS
ncbi:MAG: AAA family ATPase [Alphaproteobacteria bacterium]|nr:AAA family ATPase [Alphaproteobacteria bacterium]